MEITDQVNARKKIEKLSGNKLFLSLKRIKKDIKKSVNLDMVNYLKESELLNDWENAYGTSKLILAGEVIDVFTFGNHNSGK